jgi:hypothetical protein
VLEMGADREPADAGASATVQLETTEPRAIQLRMGSFAIQLPGAQCPLDSLTAQSEQRALHLYMSLLLRMEAMAVPGS